MTEKRDGRTERKLRLFTPFETLGFIPSDHSDCPLLRHICYFDNITNLLSLGSGRHKIETPTEFE